jgi:AcrR family transcriptional regulator
MKKAFTREDIVEAAFQVVRKQGRKNLSARTIARELNASTMPIYSTINSMKELEREVNQKFTELFIQYATTPWTNNFLVDTCFGYVRFAREEKVLFRLMFLDDGSTAQADYDTQKPIVLASLWEQLKSDPALEGLDEAQVQHIIDNMEIIIHGLACLVNFGRLPDESDEYIIRYLEEVSTFFVEREKNQPCLGERNQRQ